MTKPLALLFSTVLLMSGFGTSAFATDTGAKGTRTATTQLVDLASAHFMNLTQAERALLKNADITSLQRSDLAVAGSSSNPTDPSNDPARAEQWNQQRNVRAELIRWLCVDPDASRRVDPRGIRLFG